MKKTISILLMLAMLLTAPGCSPQPESSESPQVTAVQTEEPVTLTNRMTETERAKVSRHALTLLDAPEPEQKPAQTEHTVSVEFRTMTPDEMLAGIEGSRDLVSEEAYQQSLAFIDSLRRSGEDYRYAAHILVDGCLCTDYVPASDPLYDGGKFSFSTVSYDPETNEPTREEFSFENFDDYTAWLRTDYTERGYSEEMTGKIIDAVQAANDALQTGNYETLPEGTVNSKDESLYGLYIPEERSDYRDVWEYDRDAVEAIKDSVDEISIYDAELDTEFLVHVTRPPHYDAGKTYPVFFLTDGVWRFGDVPDLRKCMENGEAADVLLVTLGFGYDHDGTDLSFRYNMLVRERNKLLGFITDNLMPYLGEQYHIDYAASTLYGHSDGGVFAHTALCKSDQYENQPFGRYIIGSPAFWGLYYENGLDAKGCETDYGYFDRNASLGKSVFLCGGAQEDPDYADSYDGHATTLEGLAALNERLTAHGADVKYKLYESHHYQYIPEMLAEYLKNTYPPEN